MALIESFSGIRGIYGEELTKEVITKYAYAYFELLIKKNKNPKIVIGRDTRPSGVEVLSHLIEGLDCEIIDIGALPTPAIENAVRFFNCDGGIIITASHNEPEYNGFKFLDKDGAVLRPEEIDFVINRFHYIKNINLGELNSDSNQHFVNYKNNSQNANSHLKVGDTKAFNSPSSPPKKSVEGFLGPKNSSEGIFRNPKHKSEGFGDIENKHSKIIYKRNEALEEYKKFLKEVLKTEKLDCNIKILVDPNGGSGVVSKEIFDEFGVNAFYVNMVEGKFNRLIEPNEVSLKYLMEEANKYNCEFAIGFDCDADRVEILLNNGNLVSGNDILAIIAEEILSHSIKKNKTIVVNDATSYIVKEIAMKYNAIWKEVEVGEINVVDEMINLGSVIGGEGSNGGVIIPPSKCRDGILTFLVLLKIINETGKPLKEIIEKLPKYYYFKEKIKLKEDFYLIRERIKNFYKGKGFEILETGNKTGGLKTIKDNSWIWFRQSKTEDKVLRLIVDSKDEEVSLRLLEEAKKLLKSPNPLDL
jgi:phosphomannomutase